MSFFYDVGQIKENNDNESDMVFSQLMLTVTETMAFYST